MRLHRVGRANGSGVNRLQAGTFRGFRCNRAGWPVPNSDAGGEVSSPAAKPFSVSTFRSKTSGKPGLVSRRACEQKANSDFATSITVGNGPNGLARRRKPEHQRVAQPAAGGGCRLRSPGGRAITRPHSRDLLAFAGRNGPLMLFAGVLIGLIAPPLADLQRRKTTIAHLFCVVWRHGPCSLRESTEILCAAFRVEHHDIGISAHCERACFRRSCSARRQLRISALVWPFPGQQTPDRSRRRVADDDGGRGQPDAVGHA